MLVLPVGSILSLKHGPEWMRSEGLVFDQDSLLHKDTTYQMGMLHLQTGQDGESGSGMRATRTNDSEGLFSTGMKNIRRLLGLAFLAGLLYNLPFKIFFRRKRKGKRISPRLRSYCRRELLRSPRINTLILMLAYGIIHALMLFVFLNVKPEDNSLERKLFEQFFYISLVASLLVILFLFFWLKHRVHLRYIEHLFSPEELRSTIGRKQFFRIRNRMVISSAMTTLLPLGIVIFYLFLSLTTFNELQIKEFNEYEARILFGKYLTLFSELPKAELRANFFYVNAIDSILMFIGIFTGILISFIYIIFFVRWNTEDIVNPVRQLLQSMERTGEGELEQYSLVRTNDEVGQLTEGYNRMSRRIKDYFDNISSLTETYSRFVPRQFLDILGKENYTDIRLGDQIEKEMTILFSDIRSFTSLSEQMSPKQNFDFINAYLGAMEPVIRKHNGFIDKYIGDAIMALFPTSPEDAVKAAIEMQPALEKLNLRHKQSSLPEITIGIGIHTGRLMLGIVGTEGRMESTVISDAVNLAARLEGLTKEYGTNALISEDSIKKMTYPGQFQFRFLDRRRVKGKLEDITIYEIIDTDR
jgi:class 3 adenylate cyclase